MIQSTNGQFATHPVVLPPVLLPDQSESTLRSAATKVVTQAIPVTQSATTYSAVKSMLPLSKQAIPQRSVNQTAMLHSTMPTGAGMSFPATQVVTTTASKTIANSTTSAVVSQTTLSW